MSKSERKAYLKAIQTRYRRANKLKKRTILDEFCAVCGYHRKYAIRLLNQPAKQGNTQSTRRPGRKPVYHVECWRGTKPTHAAISRPFLNALISPIAANSAVAPKGPTPGIVIRR